MKILHFDLSFGCSGDMILAALVDLGAPLEKITRALASLVPEGNDVRCFPVNRGGMRALRFEALPEKPDLRALLAGAPAHAHPHPHHPHPHADAPNAPPSPPGGAGDDPGHAAHHRSYASIHRMLESSHLPAAEAKLAIKIFRLLAEAEGKVHGVPPETVKFHEVGAVDSIIDIVGIAVALHHLGPGAYTCTPADVGSGTVESAHGTLPVPAPATAELLKGFPVYTGPYRAEMVTPTGAAVLKALVGDPGRMVPGRITGIGYGAGSRELPGGSNVLRLLLMEREEAALASPFDGEVDVLECNLDDMTPELIGDLAGRLPAEGALDVFLSPVYMKKFRPGSLLTVLCRPESTAQLTEELFHATSTFGIRCHRVGRAELERESLDVETPAGRVSVKIGKRYGRPVRFSPEYESCRAASERSGRPLMEIYHLAEAAARQAAGLAGDPDPGPA